MRRVLWTGLLLIGVAGPALADNLSDRFNDDFGGGSPAAGGAPAAASPARPAPAVTPPAAPAPAADAAPAAADPAVVAPKPKPRPVRDAAHGAGDADVSAFAQEPASHPATPPAPAVKAIKSAAAAGDQVGISWNATDPSWDGMYVTNGTGGPLSVLGLRLNNRNQCQLKPYSLDKIKQVFGVQQAMKAWGSAAINLIGLPKMAPGSVLAPELPRNMQDLGVAPEEATLKAGERVPIVNGTKCNPVVEAKVDTGDGAVSIKFKRPYSGH
jgi:hypothetical protein